MSLFYWIKKIWFLGPLLGSGPAGKASPEPISFCLSNLITEAEQAHSWAWAFAPYGAKAIIRDFTLRCSPLQQLQCCCRSAMVDLWPWQPPFAGDCRRRLSPATVRSPENLFFL
ncbi:hypothetical protein L484_008655 [Morus notabilis]|uniref:Secreted protein n=1 Tax=Morus notabilis TaxID=981085 RepID=W9RUY8_9ROSA|nr:hypothetical protein L484_008655 [Morus notabilis]